MPIDQFMRRAMEIAQSNADEGGVPIASVLVLHGKIIGEGPGKSPPSVILHAEMNAIEDAGRLEPYEYAQAILYTTLSPCLMCASTIVYLGIKKVIIAENETFTGAEDFLKEHQVDIDILDIQECKELLHQHLDRLS